MVRLDYGRYVVCNSDGLVIFSSYSKKKCEAFMAQPLLFDLN